MKKILKNPLAYFTICSAFNTAPSECQQKLSTEQTSDGLGVSTSEDSSATSCS